MNKPKILIFSLAYEPFIGGAEIAVQEIAKRLAGDFDFEVITFKFNRQWADVENLDGIKIYRVGDPKTDSKYKYYQLALKKAEALSKLEAYEIVWGIMGSHGGLAAWKFKLKYPKIKYLLTEQTGDSKLFWWSRTWWWRSKFKKIYQQADGIQVISKYLYDLVKSYGYRGKIWIVPNGVKITSVSSRENKLYDDLGFKPGDKLILTVSRLVKKNAVADLVQALKYLPNEYKLLIVGEGDERSRLEQLIKQEQLADRVNLVGSIPYQDVGKYYNLADVFCRPSLSEGFGNVFVEAMSKRVPVVATPVGGITDFLEDRETGLFCEVKNPKSIAGKIRELMDNRELYNHISTRAYLLVEDKYSWEKISQQMKEIFKSL